MRIENVNVIGSGKRYTIAQKSNYSVEACKVWLTEKSVHVVFSFYLLRAIL